ncbi:MAG: glycosyltransferase [Persephonella sp.]|nr:glycosyltransferase [Persephonella sp.]
MKVLDITHFYNKKSGGVKRYLEEKVRYLSDKNINHLLILPSEEDKTQKKLNSKYYFIKSPEIPFFKPYRFILNKKKVIEVLNTEKPDIVEVGSPYLIPSWINKNKEKFGYKTIGFFHSNIEGSISSIFKSFDKIFSPPAKKWIKREYGSFDLVVSPSKYVENYLNDIGINNTATIYLGIDSSTFL